METLKVSSRSQPKSVAGAIATVVERDGQVIVQAIGAGAVNQAVKAIAIARGFTAPHGMDLVTTVGFSVIEIQGTERTGIKFIVEPKKGER